MRDPWFPLGMMLVVLIAVWLGIFGPLPEGVLHRIQQWQTLLAASVALGAAIVAYSNTNRTLRHNEDLERRRRQRKHASLRAMLPLALSEILGYSRRSALALNELIKFCEGETLPHDAIASNFAQPLPTDTLKSLADFIEYSDTVNVSILEATVARIQIHDSRVRGLVSDNRDHEKNTGIVRHQIETSLLDAAFIYAGASAFFNYARQRGDQVPDILTWDEVRHALRNLRFWEEQHPRLYKLIEDRSKNSTGPFEIQIATVTPILKIDRR